MYKTKHVWHLNYVLGNLMHKYTPISKHISNWRLLIFSIFNFKTDIHSIFWWRLKFVIIYVYVYIYMLRCVGVYKYVCVFAIIYLPSSHALKLSAALCEKINYKYSLCRLNFLSRNAGILNANTRLNVIHTYI